MSPDPADNLFPTVTGYDILEHIASTGIVHVYRARDQLLDREVAIHVQCASSHSMTQESAQRHIEAARIQGSLQHPSIPAIHQIGVALDGRPFLVMKLIRGPSLATLLEHRPNPRADLSRFVRIFQSACDAIGFAHSQGVVHRNVKTRNVMIDERGVVHVTSWELAFRPGSLTQEVLARYPDREGTVMGTPAFMPPEQARGERADERSDVFGLGGVLCHLLTGEPPFRSGQLINIVQAAAAGDLSDAFSRLDACGASPELVALCKQCLAPDRANRPPDGNAVARALSQLFEK